MELDDIGEQFVVDFLPSHLHRLGDFLLHLLFITFEQSIRLLNLRGVVRAVEGSGPGAEANVTKLLGSEVANRKGALGARLVGPLAAVREGDARRVGSWLLAVRGASIGGGTSEIIRNQIAERLLGLPRDPLIK